MQEYNETIPISNSPNSTNQTVIYGYPEEIVEEFKFDDNSNLMNSMYLSI